MRAQAAVMDSLIFLVLASGAATLLLYVSSIYGSSTNQQIIAMYNYEFASDSLATFHYAKDSDGKYFWKELKSKLAGRDPDVNVPQYLKDKLSGASGAWTVFASASPSRCPFLCFEGAETFCYPEQCVDSTGTVLIDDPLLSARPAYSSSINLKDTSGNMWTAVLKLFY